MPRWTEEELKQWIIRQNERDHHKRQKKVPVIKPAVFPDGMGETGRKKSNSTRILVGVECRRVRPVDPDNLCPKYFIDCLRYAEIIPDDRPEDIHLTVTQTQVKTYREEETILTVIKP